MAKRLLGSKKEKVTRENYKKKELQSLFSSLYIIRAIGIKLEQTDRTYRTHRKIRYAYNILTTKTPDKVELSAGRQT